MNKRMSGGEGEKIAAKYLASKGYKLLTKNFYSKFGEIDLIALDGDTLVFVEVKMRRSEKYGKPEEAVTLRKLDNIKKTGEYFSLSHPEFPKRIRVDVVAIMMKENAVEDIKLIKVD